MDVSSTPLYVQFLAGPDADHTSGLRCNYKFIIDTLDEVKGIPSASRLQSNAYHSDS